jgi:hypothetical protein
LPGWYFLLWFAIHYPDGIPTGWRREAEWLIDRLFFRDWAAREADLARFAADAPGFTEASSLATALVGTVDRFATGAGATLYVRAGDGRFERQQGSTGGAPQTAAPSVLDADEPLAVALRAGRTVARCEEVHSTVPGNWRWSCPVSASSMPSS